MMEYLHLFSDPSSHDAVYDGSSYSEPWVAYIEDDELVTYNKPSWTFDEAILDLSLYDHENLVVEEFDEGHWMWLSNSGQTVQSIMFDGINYNAAVFVSGEHEMPIPSDASFKLITDHEVSLPGREFTYDDVTVQTSNMNESYLYFYDLSSDVVTRVHCVTGGTSYFEIRHNLVQAPLVEREFSGKRFHEKLDVDLVQHLPQLTDRVYDARALYHTFGFTVENGAFVFQDHSSVETLLPPNTAVICGVKYSDFFTVNSMSGDSSNVFTMDITRKPFWTDKCYLDWKDSDLPEWYDGYSEDMSFDIPREVDFYVRLVVDGSEAARSDRNNLSVYNVYYDSSEFSNDGEGFAVEVLHSYR